MTVRGPRERRGGVGLRNIRERLAVLYGDNYRFAVLNSRPGPQSRVGAAFRDEHPRRSGATRRRAALHASDTCPAER